MTSLQKWKWKKVQVNYTLEITKILLLNLRLLTSQCINEQNLTVLENECQFWLLIKKMER